MLEQIRRNSRSFLIWVLFGIIIAVFIISFGPQAQGDLGCGASNTYVMKVGDGEVDEASWRFGMNGLNLGGYSKRDRAEVVMDMLLAREILAQAASSAGFKISDDVASEHIARGDVFILGNRADGRQIYFTDGAFDFEILDRWVNRLGLSNPDSFIEQQQRELLAEAIRGMIVATSSLSSDEALGRYVAENTTATVDAVVFSPARYRSALRLDESDLEAYLAANEEDVKAKWTELEATYQGVGKQKRVREIVFRMEPVTPEPDTDEATDPTMNAARERAEKARAQIAAGADFADIARAQSEDERFAYLGGDLGWRSVDAPGLAHKELSEAIATLEPGEVSDVIETPAGYHVLKVVDEREGDLTFEQVKHELARDLALEHYARENARRDATEALAKARAGTPLSEQFERGAAPAPAGLQRPEGFTDEQWEQILQQLQQQQRGSLPVEEGPDVPAEWRGWGDQPADDGTPAGDQPRPAAKPAKPAAEPAKPAKPAAEPAKPAAEPPATATPQGKTAPAPATPERAVTTQPAAGGAAAEKIPRPTDMKAPELRTVGPFTRSPDTISGLGKNQELVEAVFETLGEGDLVDRVYEVGGDFVILQVTERSEADMEQFAEKSDELRRRYAQEKSIAALQSWVRERCQALVEAGEVSVNRAFLSFEDEDTGELQPITYQPCSRL